MGSPVWWRLQSRREACKHQNSTSNQLTRSSCTPNWSPRRPPSFYFSVWWRQVLEYNATYVTATTTITAETPSTTLTTLTSGRQTNSWKIVQPIRSTPSAGRSIRRCVETWGLSVDVATSRTRRTGRATPPCWRSTTPRSAPARSRGATLPTCISCLPLSCQLSAWPSSSTRRAGQPNSPHSVPPPSL